MQRVRVGSTWLAAVLAPAPVVALAWPLGVSDWVQLRVWSRLVSLCLWPVSVRSAELFHCLYAVSGLQLPEELRYFAAQA
jgi:hypothetical protein